MRCCSASSARPAACRNRSGHRVADRGLSPRRLRRRARSSGQARARGACMRATRRPRACAAPPACARHAIAPTQSGPVACNRHRAMQRARECGPARASPPAVRARASRGHAVAARTARLARRGLPARHGLSRHELRLHPVSRYGGAVGSRSNSRTERSDTGPNVTSEIRRRTMHQSSFASHAP